MKNKTSRLDCIMIEKQDIHKITTFRKIQNLGASTFRQLIALFAIEYDPTITTTELAKVVGSNRSSASELCQRLKKNGLVTWEHARRGRSSRRYNITPAGFKIIEEGRKL